MNVILGPIAMQREQSRSTDRLESFLWSFLISAAAWVLWADRRGEMQIVDVLVGWSIAASVIGLLSLWGRK
jgi:hypothetical protein